MRNEFPLSSFTTGIGICSFNFICWCLVLSVGKVMQITLQCCVSVHGLVTCDLRPDLLYSYM
jgi:hypothetical protein